MPVLLDLSLFVRRCILANLLMVPAHIKQDCNAYDAEKSGAGIISSDFNLQQLLEFAKDFTTPIVILCIGYVELNILC